MITKEKGAEDNCPSCGQILVCREVTYKDQTKLQWQYKDKEEAHFSFDFKTKKSSCKESSPKSDSVAAVYSADSLTIAHLDIPMAQQEEIMKVASEETQRMLVVLKAVNIECGKAGINNPAGKGMIFNQICENRRANQ